MKTLFIALLCVFTASRAFAASPEIISLVDIQGQANPELLIGATGEQVKNFYPSGKMPSQILAYFVKVNGLEILFDTGLNDGHIIQELAKNNIKPEDIKIIMLTHLHPDHFGGLVDSQNKAAFTNAEIYISKIEYDYWVNNLKNEKVIQALDLYPEKINLFDFDREIFAGIKAIDSSGHTPGHTAFDVDGKFLIVGDIMHFPEIQLPYPDISVRYDVDPVKARESRKKMLDYAIEKNLTIAGMHITVPGICKIMKSGNGYEKR